MDVGYVIARKRSSIVFQCRRLGYLQSVRPVGDDSGVWLLSRNIIVPELLQLLLVLGEVLLLVLGNRMIHVCS